MAHGRRAIETVRALRPDLDGVEELKNLEDMEISDTDGVAAVEGVLPILETLPADRWAVVTSATERLARSRLEHGGIPAPAWLVSADRVTRGKPDPEPYRTGAQHLGLKPEECLVIEDAASGVIAGHAAGCKVLATLFSHSLESLSAADWVVDSLKDVRVSVTDGWIEFAFEPMTRGKGH